MWIGTSKLKYLYPAKLTRQVLTDSSLMRQCVSYEENEILLIGPQVLERNRLGKNLKIFHRSFIPSY
jgi:hypothetical protein